MNYDTIYEHAADNYGLITSSEAKVLGVPNIELVKLAHRGRLSRLGHGVYRVKHYIPTMYDKYCKGYLNHTQIQYTAKGSSVADSSGFARKRRVEKSKSASECHTLLFRIA